MTRAERLKSPPLIRRRDAAQAVLDRFSGQTLDWKHYDCGRMAAMLLRQMGHNPRWGRFTGYESEFGARKRLKRAGFADLPAVLDDLGLFRTQFATARAGDLVGFPDDNDWTALGVGMGKGQFLAIAADGVFRVGGGLPSDMAAKALAWRVDPI